VLPTMACWSQIIRSGMHTKAHWQTNSAVYHVFQGEGHTIINGERLAWRSGDFFVVPPWAWPEPANDTREDAVLFSVQDTPSSKPSDSIVRRRTKPLAAISRLRENFARNSRPYCDTRC
jgi:gentisate 1,2-dioxygenase